MISLFISNNKKDGWLHQKIVILHYFDNYMSNTWLEYDKEVT